MDRAMPVVPATDEAIAQAAGALAEGAIVAFPTETVYGLGADARQEKRRLYHRARPAVASRGKLDEVDGNSLPFRAWRCGVLRNT